MRVLSRKFVTSPPLQQINGVRVSTGPGRDSLQSANSTTNFAIPDHVKPELLLEG